MADEVNPDAPAPAESKPDTTPPKKPANPEPDPAPQAAAPEEPAVQAPPADKPPTPKTDPAPTPEPEPMEFAKTGDAFMDLMLEMFAEFANAVTKMLNQKSASATAAPPTPEKSAPKTPDPAPNDPEPTAKADAPAPKADSPAPKTPDAVGSADELQPPASSITDPMPGAAEMKTVTVMDQNSASSGLPVTPDDPTQDSSMGLSR